MGKYTKEEIEAIKERKRKARNREVFSEYIRIGESDLYDWHPTRRAVLKEIAFMQCNDEGAAAKISEHSPYKGRYTGWCFASQKRIAFRCGCSERWVRDCVRLFEKDGVLQSRMWTDHMGYKHTEYHVNEDVVTAHQRGKAEEYLQQDRDRAPRRGGNRQPNKGSFTKGNKAASHRNSQPLPQEWSGVSDRNTQPFAIGTLSRKPQEDTAVSETADPAVKGDVIQGEAPLASLATHSGGLGFSQSNSARDLASDAAGRRDEQVGSACSTKSKPKTKDSGSSAPRQPVPNYLCYPELFKGRVDANGNWLEGVSRRAPKCHRCDGNIYPRENHVCSGYVPKLPFGDMEDHMGFMEAQRESIHEELMARRRIERQERLEELKEELGDGTQEFEF